MTSHRADFDVAEGEIWFNGGSFSPMPRVGRVGLEEGYRVKASPTTMPSDSTYRYPDDIRERLARVMGLPAEEFGITTSMVGGAVLIAQGLRWKPGDRVLVGPDEYPGNVYPWRALEAHGVTCEQIGRSGHALTAPELEEALARRDHVRVLAIAATHYLSGDLHPLSELAAIAHRHGTLLVVDGSQTVGAVALDWAGMDLDAILFSGYKWLLGPYGTGALWVRPALRDALIPVNGNFWALQGRDFEALLRLEPTEYEKHGRVFDVGQAASYLNIATFRSTLDYLLGIGVPTVEATVRAIQDRLVARLGDTPLRPVTRLDAAHRSPLLLLEADSDVDLHRLMLDLRKRHVHVSTRGGRMRVAAGIWCDPAEADTFVAAVTDSLAGQQTV